MKKFISMLIVTCALLSNAPLFCIDIFNSLIVAPRANSTIVTANPTIVGVAFNEKASIKRRPVTIYIDNRIVGIAKTNSKGVWSYKLKSTQSLTDGYHYAEAYIELAGGKQYWLKGSYFNVVAARTQPIFRSGNVNTDNSVINFPFEDSYVNDTTPTVIGSLSDDDFNPVSGETVNVKIDSVTVGSPVSDSNGVFAYALSSALSEGSHVIDAHCVQSNANLTGYNFTIDVTAPAAPAIALPTQNDTLTNSLVTISGTTEAWATMSVYLDSSEYYDIAYADEFGDWSIEYELANGAHSVTAQSTDLANNTSSMSSARDFTVNA